MLNEAELQKRVVDEAPALPANENAEARIAGWSLAVGLLIGWLGSVFFVDKPLGLSFPLYIALLTAAALAATHWSGKALSIRRVWLAVPALFFAGMVAIREDETLRDLNILAALSLGVLWVYFLSRQRLVDDTGADEYFFGMFSTSAFIGVLPLLQVFNARGLLTARSETRGRTLRSVGRGLLLALPILLVFTLLLTSADSVFSALLDDVWRILGLETFDSLVRQIIFTAFFGWRACGMVAYIASQYAAKAAAEPLTPDAAPTNKQKRRPILLSMIESSIVLGSVNLLFGVFVIIQFVYFFGGSANVSVEGFTYAQYARRGFFELVAVAVLTLGLVLTLDWVTVRSDRRQHFVFRALAVMMVLFVFVMMVSALSRMRLYEDAFGFTHLRVYVSTFIPWLGALFCVFLLSLFRVRINIFSVGLLCCAIGYGAHLNLMNVEGYIADHNIQRYLNDGEALDIDYLYGFSVDAIDPMVQLWQQTASGTPEHETAGQWLTSWKLRLDALYQSAGGSSIFAFNNARTHAWAVLQALENLPALNVRS